MITFMRFIILSLMSMFSSVFVGVVVFIGISFGQDMIYPQLIAPIVLWSGAVIIVLTILASSPLGDSIAGLFFPIRRQSMRDERKIRPALERIQQFYREKYGKNIAVKVCVMDLPNIDGLALGQETVAISTGLLKVASDEEMASAIAHEIAHLHYGDGVFNITAIVANLPIVLISNFLDGIARVVPIPSARFMFRRFGVEWLINMSIAVFLIMVIY